MLASCLSNHPDIFCVRGEPLLDGEAWRDSLPGMTDSQIPKIIHLVRGNVIRCCLSQLATGTRGKYAHSTGKVNTTAFAVNAVQFVQKCRKHVEEVEVVQEWIDESGLESITVAYEEMIGGEGRSVSQMEGKASNKVCEFLGVDYPVVLETQLRKVNPARIKSMVLDWNKLRAALAVTEFAEMI
jgi:LPS sulfotransferase NodH